MAMDLWLLLVCAFFGLLWGSFANAAIYRIPLSIPLGFKSHARSFCPECEHPIHAKHNIPVLSFFLLKGRCAYCSVKIPPRYPIVEILTSITFVLAAWIFLQYRGFSWGYADLAWELSYFALQLYFLWSLIVVTYIDIDFRIIPDRFSLGNWLLAILAIFVFGEPGIWEGLLGGLFGFGSFYLLAWGYEKLKGVEGLGFGDVKMMGWLGTWLGFEWVPLMILMASVVGMVVGLWAARKGGQGLQTALPFGPFLALAAAFVWLLKSMQFSTENFVF